MNTPNKLTVLRIILVPIFMLVILTDIFAYKFLIATIVFILASITDFLDGNIARKKNIVTDFGKFADPIADKILVLSAFLCFTELGICSCVVPMIVLTREFIVTSMRLIAAAKGTVVAANIWGKIKTVSQMIAIITTLIIFYVYQIIGYNILCLDIVYNVLIWLSVAFTIISGVVYMIQNKDIITSK